MSSTRSVRTASNNDGDGTVDYQPIRAAQECPITAKPANPECSDGIDNDGNGKVDYPADPSCTGVSDNNELNPQFSDGVDNDGDGKVDYPVDPDCTDNSDNNELTKCSDGIDNHGDANLTTQIALIRVLFPCKPR